MRFPVILVSIFLTAVYRPSVYASQISCRGLFDQSHPDSMLDEEANAIIKEGRFHTTRGSDVVMKAIPQLEKIYDDSASLPVTKRPVFIDLGAGKGTAAGDFSETDEKYRHRTVGRFLNMVAITAEKNEITAENSHLKIFAGQFFENLPDDKITSAIRALRESNSTDPNDQLADGGYDIYGVFSYTSHPELAFRKLNLVLKKGVKFFIVTPSGHIDAPGGLQEYSEAGSEQYSYASKFHRLDGAGSYSYLAGEQPDKMDTANDSRVLMADGRQLPLFDYLASLGGFRVEYWNHGKGPITKHAMGANGLPAIDLKTQGDVIILTKTGDVENHTSRLEVVRSIGTKPPTFHFREVEAPGVVSREKRIERDIQQLQSVGLAGSLVRFKKNEIGYDVNQKSSARYQAQVELFLPEAVLKVNPVAYGEVFLSILSYDIPKALDYFASNRHLISGIPHFGIGYQAVYDIMSGNQASLALNILRTQLKNAEGNSAIDAERLQRIAIRDQNPYGATIEWLLLGKGMSLFSPAHSDKYVWQPELARRGWQAAIDKWADEDGSARYSSAPAEVMYNVNQTVGHLRDAWNNLPQLQSWLRKNVSSYDVGGSQPR